MFGVLSLAAVALVAASTASAAAIPTHYPVPSSYDAKYLESYDDYHTRYLALDCQDKHNTAFFTSCCHPLLKGQTLASRPKECTAAAVAQPSSSSAAHVPASSALASGGSSDSSDDDCEDEGDDSSDNTGDDTGDDGEDCDDGDNESTTTSAQPTTTPKPTSTKPTSTPKPTSTHKTTSTSKAASTPAPPSGQNTGGFATYFYQKGVAGACGTVHKDTDLIAAIDEARYGNSGRKSSLCGQQVHLTNIKNGKSVTVTIADDCPTCANGNSIDLSKSAFEAIAPLSDGMVGIVWNFV